MNGDCIFADTCRVIWEMSAQSRDINGVDQGRLKAKARPKQGLENQADVRFACNGKN